METTRRRLLQKSHTESGSVVQEMKSYSFQPVKNDGRNDYGNTRIKSIRSNGPFNTNTEIELPLVSGNWDVTEFENSFIHLNCEAQFRFDDAPTLGTAGAELDDFEKAMGDNQFVFIGLKASPHIIRDYRFKHNDTVIQTSNQASAITENFLYSTFKADSEISNHKFVFSTYKEVSERENSICGMYIPLKEIAAGTLTKKFEIVIPYQELLPLEAFNEFPNCIFGDLTFNFHVSYDAFVYCEVNPKESIAKGITQGLINLTTPHLSEVLAVDASTFDYQHSFEQVGIPSQAQFVKGFVGNKVEYATCPNFCPYISNLMVNDAWCEVKGYNIVESAKAELYAHFTRNPFSVPAQKIEVYNFPQGPTSGGLSTSATVTFNHTTEVYILCPTNAKQLTVIRNPMLDRFQIQINNKRLPDAFHSTISAPFITQQIQSSDFEGMWKPNDDWEHSMTDARITPDGKIIKPWTDNTCWVPVFQVERQGSGGEMWFDGIDKVYAKVDINAKPLYQNVADVYFMPNGSTPPPSLVACQDVYWIWRIINGVVNVQYVTNYTYAEGFANPDLDCIKGKNITDMTDFQGERTYDGFRPDYFGEEVFPYQDIDLQQMNPTRQRGVRTAI